MNRNFDDELNRMDEIENYSDSPITRALSLDDPIAKLSLRDHPIVSSGINLKSVIKILRDKKVGCVMIEKNDQIIGVMTERDFLLRVTAKGLDLESEIIDNYMTKNPETLTLNDPISYALFVSGKILLVITTCPVPVSYTHLTLPTNREV